MDKILLINLKKLGDVFQSGHLINSIKSLNPNTQVDILCFEESARAAKTLLGVNKIHTINRKKIVSFYKNNIYSDGLAFNALYKTLEHVIEDKYNRIINYSNDTVTTYLTSYLSSVLGAEVFGIRFNSKNSVTHSCPYSIVLNDVSTTSAFTPLNFNDNYHYLCGLEKNQSHGTKVKSNTNHDQTAATNFDRLRATKNNNGDPVYIIGVQLASGSETKSIPESVLTKTLDYFLASSNFVPILLNAPTNEERELVKKFNMAFNNKLVSVEADFIALPSVLKGIDLLLTPDTSVKHLADLVNTPCLEVSLGEAPFLKQGTINPSSAIISRPANLRVFKEGVEDKEQVTRSNQSLHPELIIHTISALLGTEISDSDIDQELDSGFCVYRPVELSTGVSYVPISGPYSEGYETKRMLARAVALRLASPRQNTDLENREIYDLIYKKFDRRLISKVVNEEKQALSELTKDLLSTLRGLIQTQEDRRKAVNFVDALEKLISRCFDNNLSAIPTLFFRARLESLNATTLDENFKGVEGLLYELKSNLQNCFNVFKELESFDKDKATQTTVKPEARL